MENLSKSYNGMDPTTRHLMWAGLGAGGLGLANAAMNPNAGWGTALGTAGGLGLAGVAAGAGGMFGPDAQKWLGGVGSQIGNAIGPQATQGIQNVRNQYNNWINPAAPGTPQQDIKETAPNPNMPQPGGAGAASTVAGLGVPAALHQQAVSTVTDYIKGGTGALPQYLPALAKLPPAVKQQLKGLLEQEAAKQMPGNPITQWFGEMVHPGYQQRYAELQKALS